MCKLTYKKNNTGDFIMKNTVKFEQFKEVTETELQEIRGWGMENSRINT